jgi:type VI protein secretion system component VasK
MSNEMMKTNYDFREGMDLNKIVYKDKRSCDCREIVIYIVLLIVFWTLLCAYYAFWHYFYLNYLTPTFIALIIVTAILYITWLTLAIINCRKYYAKKDARKAKKEEEAKRVEDDKAEKVRLLKLNKETTTKNQVEGEEDGKKNGIINTEHEKLK